MAQLAPSFSRLISSSRRGSLFQAVAARPRFSRFESGAEGWTLEVVVVALLVIDMQLGSFGAETPRHDVEGVVERINGLADGVRREGGVVVFIQHHGPEGDVFEPGSEGWKILPSLQRLDLDPLVCKRACDAFYETSLAEILAQHEARQLIVTGCATDFCVDTTVRAAASRDYEVLVVEDGHTTADRPHVDAESVIRHHNWVWQNMVHPRTQIEVLPASSVIARLESESGMADADTRRRVPGQR